MFPLDAALALEAFALLVVLLAALVKLDGWRRRRKLARRRAARRGYVEIH